MTNLTEQWKKGELPEGWYYVKDEDGQVIIAEYYAESIDRETNETECVWSCLGEPEQVLAEVLSFDEYQQLLSDQLAKNEGVEINAELEAENTKLKELLKKCYLINEMVTHTFNWLETIVTPSQKHICPKVVGGINETQQKINEVLGEE